MRSRTDPRAWEWPARGMVLAVFTVLLWRAWAPSPGAGAETVSGESLERSLPRLTRSPPPRSIHVRLETIPAAVQRDWLAALQRAGSRVTWSGDVGASSIEVTATAEPHSWYLVRAAAPVSGALVIADESRRIAGVAGPSGTGAVAARASALVGRVSALTAAGEAVSRPPAPPRVGRLAVFGPAGWETKFVITALEESGWTVDARLTIAPGVIIGGVGAGLDTARYSAVVLVDGIGPEPTSALERYVSSGGGLVIAGSTLRSPGIAQLVPGRVSQTFTARDSLVIERALLGGVALTPASNAVPLERRDGVPVVVAARYGRGRVVTSGYRDTWRWRMQGDEHSLERHREWWSSLAAAVAYAPDTAVAAAPESAPLAAWVSALGPVADAPPGPRQGATSNLDWLLFSVAAVSLLAEIVSRRRRGLM